MTIDGTHYGSSFPSFRGRKKHLSAPYIKMLCGITCYFSNMRVLKIMIEHVKSQGEIKDTMLFFFRSIPDKLIFLETFIFEMDYYLNIFIKSFLAFENSELS